MYFFIILKKSSSVQQNLLSGHIIILPSGTYPLDEMRFP